MQTQSKKDNMPIYRTITGGRIPLSNLTEAERCFLEKLNRKYNARQDWTRFAAWWNAEFNAAGLSTCSVLYRVCQDLESRLGINQCKVSPPDYRDYLVELIDTHFGSRQDFCRATGVDPGQLSRVLANRADLSMKVLQKVLGVLHARLIIQTDEDSRARTSIDQAASAIANAVTEPTPLSAPETPRVRGLGDQDRESSILDRLKDARATQDEERIMRAVNEFITAYTWQARSMLAKVLPNALQAVDMKSLMENVLEDVCHNINSSCSQDPDAWVLERVYEQASALVSRSEVNTKPEGLAPHRFSRD